MNISIYLTKAFSSELLQSPSVLFAGYKVPHPLLPFFEIKIQTVSATATNPAVTPVEVLEKTCQKLIGTLSNIEGQFKREFAYRDVTSGGGADGHGEGGEYGGMAGSSSGGAWGGTGRGDYLDF